MEHKLNDREVSQNIIRRGIISHNLSDLKLKNIKEINSKKYELYKNIDEKDRFYTNTKKVLDKQEIKEFYRLAKECYKNANIEYDETLETYEESWLPCYHFSENNRHKHKTIEISNFGRVKVDSEVKAQVELEKDSGELHIEEFGSTRKVWTLVAETWIKKPVMGCDFDVHHLSNNGYDQRPENLIWLRRCEHKVIHPFMRHCKNCNYPEHKI